MVLNYLLFYKLILLMDSSLSIEMQNNTAGR